MVHDDAEQAQSAAELLYPASIDDATFHWCRRGLHATRVIFRAKYTKTATVTTDPVVRLIGAWGAMATDDTMPTDGTVRFMRLDNADANAAGITLDLISAGANTISDATYAYSDPTTLTPYDLLGCDFFGILIETAANVNTGTVPIECLLLN